MAIIQRFVVVGDMHKDYINTSSTSQVGVDFRGGVPTEPREYNDRFNLLLQSLKIQKDTKGLDFVAFNGDIIHSTYTDRITPLTEVKNLVSSQVGVPLYASYGNHDRATNVEWFSVFGHNRDHAYSVGDYGYIFINTSDETGARQICISEIFLETKLQEFNNKKGVFVFAHIPRYGGIRADDPSYDSPQCDNIMNMFTNQDNLLGVFHSHFHEEDRMFVKDNKNYIFTGHFAQYGLNYYGYRIVEIHDNGEVICTQYNVTNNTVRYTNVLSEATEPIMKTQKTPVNIFAKFNGETKKVIGVWTKEGNQIKRVNTTDLLS